MRRKISESQRVRKRAAAFDGQKTKKTEDRSLLLRLPFLLLRVCVCLQTLTLTLKVAAATAVLCVYVSF